MTARGSEGKRGGAGAIDGRGGNAGAVVGRRSRRHCIMEDEDALCSKAPQYSTGVYNVGI